MRVLVYSICLLLVANLASASNHGGEAMDEDSESTRRIQDDRPAKRRMFNKEDDVKHLLTVFSEWTDPKPTISSATESKPTFFDDFFFEMQYQTLQSRLRFQMSPMEAKLFLQLSASVDAENDQNWATSFQQYNGPLSDQMFFQLLSMAVNHDHPEPVRALMKVDFQRIRPSTSFIQSRIFDATSLGRFDHAIAMAMPFKSDPSYSNAIMNLAVNLMNAERFEDVRLLLQGNEKLGLSCRNYLLKPEDKDANIFMNYWQEEKFIKCLETLDISSEEYLTILKDLKERQTSRGCNHWIAVQVVRHFAEKSVDNKQEMVELLMETSTFTSTAMSASIEPFWTEQHKEFVSRNLKGILFQLLSIDHTSTRLHDVIFNFVITAARRDVETTRSWIELAILMAEDANDNSTEGELSNMLSQLTF